MTAIQFIDQYLTDHKDRGSFGRIEVVDLLLDIRLLLTSTGGANGSDKEESAAPDRTDTDDRELALSGSEVVETAS
jgi:hypothetical protein